MQGLPLFDGLRRGTSSQASTLFCGIAAFPQHLRRENKDMANNKTPRKTIELALQGGGAHGALTWG
ncbi:MAG: hypothetical protein KA225_05530, partial [Thauera sp.]|nr:hypothetical protein [Thauera sp.]